MNQAQRMAVIASCLLALFLGALDALVMSAAMPTIVAELGGLHLYSWVYSAYFLSRAVSLPVFGKLADLFQCRRLLLVGIGLFVLSSTAAGMATGMAFLIAARVVQGIGAGAIFALVYIVLADVSTPERRGRTLSLASSVWGISSVLGPTLGGLIVTYFSWRWIFFMNIPLGMASLWGVAAFLFDLREKRSSVSLDLLGVATLTTAVLAFLFVFLLGGQTYPWVSPEILGLSLLALGGGAAFVWAERRAVDPVLSIGFFRDRGFSVGNGAVFLSSFAIFSLFAFAPLFIQGAQGKSPMEVGTAMVSLSLGWSLGSLALGQVQHRFGQKSSAVAGGLFLTGGCAMTLFFHAGSSSAFSFGVFFVVGVGMGLVALSTLLVVQSRLHPRDLGVATSSNQFARTLGGAVGVGVCGSFVSNRIGGLMESYGAASGAGLADGEAAGRVTGQIETLLRPEVQAAMTPQVREWVRDTVGSAVGGVFWIVTIAALCCLAVCLLLPGRDRGA